MEEALHTRVGRWMSREEYQLMVSAGRMVESHLGGSRVAFPADPNAYKAHAKDDIYVEFDLESASFVDLGNGWAKVIGPNSTEGRLAKLRGLQIPEMPRVWNVEVVAR